MSYRNRGSVAAGLATGIGAGSCAEGATTGAPPATPDTVHAAAAEVVASIALVTAVAETHPLTAAVALTDCAPATSAFNAMSSRSAQIHSLLGYARQQAPRWLGVHIRRLLNTNADRLSHPSRAASVVAEAEAAGLRVQRVRLPEAVQPAAMLASHLPLRHEDRSWQQ